MPAAATKDTAFPKWMTAHVDQLFKDVDRAMSAYSKHMTATGVRFYPDWLLKDSKADSLRVQKAATAFIGVWEKARRGREIKPKALERLHHDLVHALCALEAQNARLEAVEKANIARVAMQLSTGVEAFIRHCGEVAPKLAGELDALKADLEAAEQDITEAKAQLAINATVNAIVLLLPQLRVAKVLGATVGSMAGGALLDAALGPSGPNPYMAQVGAMTQTSQRFTERTKSVLKHVDALRTVITDHQEIRLAKEIAARIEAKAARVRKAAARAMAVWTRGQDELLVAQKIFEKSMATWRSESRKAGALTRERDGHVKAFRKGLN